MTWKPAAAPLLKYPGGKTWAAKQFGPVIAQHLADTPGCYYVEPFAGSAAMALALAPAGGALTEANPEVANFLTCVQENPGEVAWRTSGLTLRGFDKEAYYSVRDEYEPEDRFGRAARLLYLNRLCFNGVMRVNASGKFNVPYGDAVYRPSIIGRSSRDAIASLFPNREKIEHASRALRRLYIANRAASEVLAEVLEVPGELFLYLDPPYHESFDQYTAERFSEDDQAELATLVREADERGIVWMMHNNNTDLIEGLYSWARYYIPVDEKRSVAAKPKDRVRGKCVIATNSPVIAAALGE